MLSRILLLAIIGSAAPILAPLVAQDPAEVEALAPLLMAEDRRAFDAPTLSDAVNHSDPLVRRTAAMTIGRIRDLRGTALLLPLLSDRDMTVVTAAFFGLGLMRDTSAVGAIAARLRAADSLSAGAAGEAATALARIGGQTAATFLAGVLNGSADVPRDRLDLLVPNALIDGWHLGALMPAQAMLHYVNDTSTDLRWRAIYSLGRMRVPAAGQAVLRALREQAPSNREVAARWLTRRFADTAGLAAIAVKTDLVRALDDDQAGVRTNAVGSLATFGDSTVAGKVIQLLSDQDPNVRVAAASALGDIRGAAAAKALNDLLLHPGAWALRRAALLALAHADSALFVARAAAWLAGADFRDRMAGLQAWGTLSVGDPAVFRAGAADADPRVIAAALDAWRASDTRRRRQSAPPDTALSTLARTLARAPDPGVRAAAVEALRPSVSAADVDLLFAAWHQSLGDPDSDARLAVLGAMHDLMRRQPDLFARIDDPSHRDFADRPDDPVVRGEVARSWPELARRWGGVAPIDTRRTLDDYRSVVRTLVLAADDPHVTIDVEGRGSIDVQLLGHEAPLTVTNFLRLVDRHYFDRSRMHRVVPNFVIQDGDPTGTGNGGPGWSIRDEINPERYVLPMIGMALSGPDTGGSQWFINLSPQPHLDGQYTIFGKVAGSFAPLSHIVQGDVIRSIHR